MLRSSRLEVCSRLADETPGGDPDGVPSRDEEVMEEAADELASRGIPYEVSVLSAHRDPDAVREYSLSAESRGLKVIIAGAGKAAALPGVVASYDRPAGHRRAHPHVRPGRARLAALAWCRCPRACRWPAWPSTGRATPPSWRRRSCASAGAGRPQASARSEVRPGLPMIPRYSTPEMAALWTDEARMATWLQVEMAVCEAWTRWARSREEAVAEIKAKAAFDVDRVNEIEEITQHDVIAFCQQRGRERGRRLQVHPLRPDLVGRARHRPGSAVASGPARCWPRRPGSWAACSSAAPWSTGTRVMIGRTHGVHAEPITFGMVLGLWAFEVQRGLERLERADRAGGGGQDLGRRGQLRQRRSAGGAVHHVHPGPGRRAHLHPGGAARPARRVHVGPGPARRAPSRRSPCRCGTTSAPRSWRPRSTSLPGRRARRPCRTSATPSSPSGSAARPGSSAAT